MNKPMNTNATELAQRMRIAATMATQGDWSYVRSGFNSIVRASVILPKGGASRVVLCKLFRTEWRGELKTAQDAQFIALANPANVLTLIDALEKAQTKNELVAGGIAVAEKQHERIAYLEKRLKGTEESLIAATDMVRELESRTVKLPKLAVVMWNLSDQANHRTSAENVNDVLDAIRAAMLQAESVSQLRGSGSQGKIPEASDE